MEANDGPNRRPLGVRGDEDNVENNNNDMAFVPPQPQQQGGQRFLFDGIDLDVVDGLNIDADVNFPQFMNPGNMVPAAPDHLDVNLFHDILPGMLPQNVAARIGLNETPLTKAIAAGNFDLAEKFIHDASDPEYLNDGSHAAIPLNLALSGRCGTSGQPRHLKLARLLVRRGANVNLRIPNHDLETASESPLEMLVSFYLDLLRTFKANAQETSDTNRLIIYIICQITLQVTICLLCIVIRSVLEILSRKMIFWTPLA